MKKWHELNPSAFEEFEQQIISEYPTLHIKMEDGSVLLRGSLFIKNESKKVVDRYSIEIKIPEDYPRGVPVVREVDGRLPKVEERHFNPKDQTACLFFRDERYKFYPEGTNVIDFIKGPVESFFIGQTYFDLTGKWIFGERGHGVNGTVDFYGELLNLKNPYQIIRFLKYLISKKIQKHAHCYCGSNKRLDKCHIRQLLDLRSKISRNDAKKSLQEIEDALRKIEQQNTLDKGI